MIKFYKETNFKQTPTGKIPNDWQIQKLGDIIIFIKGKKPKEMTEHYEEGYLPYLSAEYLRENKTTNFVKPSNDVILVNDGDLILLWDGSNAGEFFYGKRGVLSSTMVKIEQREQVFDRKFLFYILKMKEGFLKRQTKGTGIPHVDEDVLKNIILPNPSLSEQRVIAEILSVVDLAIQRTNEIIAKTERLKKGLMQTLLTRGIGHKEFKETPIGKIPKTWQIIKLGEALELCQYGLSIPMKDYGRYPIIRMDEIVDGYVIPQITKYVDLDDETFRFFKLEKGDILFNRTNAYELVGRTGIFLLDGDYVFASYLIRLRPKREIFDSHFLTYYLIFSQDRLRQLATKAVHQANINATNLKKIIVPKPPFEEQQKIANILSSLDRELEFERKEKKKLDRIKRGLMDLFLTGKVRVEVG